MTTCSTITLPGQMISHGAAVMNLRPSDSMKPHSGVGGWEDRPSSDRPLRVSRFAPMSWVMFTSR